VRTDHVLDFKAALVDEGLAPATTGKILGLLKQSLEAAIAAGMIPRNPASGVPRPSVTAAGARERRALSEAELGELLSPAAGTPHETTIRLALATGMRQSELLGLRWSDVDLDRRTLAVQQTIQEVDGESQVLPPKTRNSRRVIELSAASVTTLRTHQATQNAERLRLGQVWAHHDLVVPDPTGGPERRRRFYGAYMRIVKADSLDRPDEINWHTLRHTAASLWIKPGVDVFTVSRRLGHSKTSFTMDVYAHLLEGQQRAAAEALDHLLAQ
jgi:integrase